MPSENPAHYMRTMIFMERGSCWPWTNRTYVCTVACLNLKVLSVVFDTVYEVVSSRLFAILLSKYTTMVMMTLRRTSLLECMHATAVSCWLCPISMYVCIAVYLNFKGDYKVFDAV